MGRDPQAMRFAGQEVGHGSKPTRSPDRALLPFLFQAPTKRDDRQRMGTLIRASLLEDLAYWG